MAEVSEHEELLENWVRALRSGKYTHVREWMRTPNGFDAYGVLCDVYDPNGWDKKTENDDRMHYIHPNGGTEDCFPTRLINELEMTEVQGRTIWKLNDYRDGDRSLVRDTNIRLEDQYEFVKAEPYERVALYIERYILLHEVEA